MTYPNWCEPVRLLELRTGPSTPRQRELAEQFGLAWGGTEPHDVVGLMLEEHVRLVIWGTQPKPATARQRAFLVKLGATRAADPSLTKAVASAWIEHHLALRTIERLRTLGLTRGDAVIKRTIWRHPETGLPHESRDYFIVSTIGAGGLVYFKGGNGRCGWPSSLERATEADSPSDFPQFP